MDYKDCKSISYKLVAPSCKNSKIFVACQNYQFLSTQPILYGLLSFFFLLEFVSSELHENQYQLNQLKLHEAAQADMDSGRSYAVVISGKVTLRICNKFTGEHSSHFRVYVL